MRAQVYTFSPAFTYALVDLINIEDLDALLVLLRLALVQTVSHAKGFMRYLLFGWCRGHLLSVGFRTEEMLKFLTAPSTLSISGK